MILTGRTFRMPVYTSDSSVNISTGRFDRLADRWAPSDSARYYYLRASEVSGDFEIRVQERDMITAKAVQTVQVRTLNELRNPFRYNDAQWPRRWPLGKTISTTKNRQTMQDDWHAIDKTNLEWWMAQPDAIVWNQIPNAEIPRAHFVNVHQGSPTIGTAIFNHGGFYPWRRQYLPVDYKSTCPASGDVFPSNNFANGDYVSGEYPDDGYGYFDAEGNVFLFVATYTRDQYAVVDSAISAMTERLRHTWDDATARIVGLLLLRYAQEECYVAAVPQFRYGPSKAVEEPWDWGQPDWGAMDEPVAALRRMGSLRYSIDTPYLAARLALAYDTIWPFLKRDRELIERANAQGLTIKTNDDAIQLIEEMLSCLLQCILDNAASSNMPRESLGALALIRALDRPDAQDVLDWLYDEGPERLRVFTTNDFLPDGTPPEATGGYNSIHSDGIFDLEDSLRKLRSLRRKEYPESRYPSLTEDVRAARIARIPREITMGGKSWFQYGDGSAPGTSTQLNPQRMLQGRIAIAPDCLHAPMSARTLDYAVEFTGDETVRKMRDAVKLGIKPIIGSTIHDSAGLAILRANETTGPAAAGIVYGDAVVHRHRDLLDVQLVAFDRPFLTDLGYPQSWASIRSWESHWATHNTIWGVLEDEADLSVAGRGRLVRYLAVDGVHILDVEADRWVKDGAKWSKTGVSYRRLIALVETDGDGVALVDLSRITGGTEHWRTCRGLEGDFSMDEMTLSHRSGTVAGVDVMRCEMEAIHRPDDTALACMDEVATAPVGNMAWRGTWQSRIEPNVELDVHQLYATEGAELFTARATATMGTPEESNYCFRTLLWKREPTANTDTTSVDLVFEPRIGESMLSSVSSRRDKSSIAVDLETRAGRRVSIYWAPEEHAEPFDGAMLDNGLGVITDNKAVSLGAKRFCGWSGEPGQIVRRILSLDRDACTVDIDAIDEIKSGDYVAINPARGRMYRVERVEGLGDDRMRLRLEITSILGRSQIESVGSEEITLTHFLITRTGYLDHARLERDSDGSCCTVLEAFNPSRSSTVVTPDPASCSGMKTGEWVRIVDYIVGDSLRYEPRRSHVRT